MTGRGDDETQEHSIPPSPPADQPIGWPGQSSPLPPPVTSPHWPGSSNASPPVEAGRRQPPAHYRTSGFVALGAIVLLLFGLLYTFVGTVGLIAGDLLVDWIRAGAAAMRLPSLSRQLLNETLTVAAVILLIVGLLHELSAVGALAHRNWGRWLGATLALLGTLLGALGLYGALVVQPEAGQALAGALAIVAAVLVLYAYALLVLVFGSDHFARLYRGG